MNKHWLKLLAMFLLLSSLLLTLQPVFATAGGSGSIDLTTLGSAYTQGFDDLANTGTTNSLSINGWYLDEAGTSSANNGQYRADNGNNNGGDTYSYGATSGTDRAFGQLLSGTLTPIIGASFTNDTGETITSLDVAYTGEMWRLGTSSRLDADRLDFQLSTDATSLTIGTWDDYDDLDFSSPVTNSTLGLRDGNLTANRTNLSFTISDLNIADGDTFWIRWNDFNVTGADDGLAVDDFSLTPNADTPAAPVINEMQVSTTGTDFEFFEIAGAPSTDLSALTLVGIESDAGTTAGTIDRVISLSGQAIPADGFWVGANATAVTTYGITPDMSIPADAFENSTATYFLVSGFSGTSGTDYDANDDGVLDSTPWTAIIDSVNIRDAGTSDLSYGAPITGPDGSNLPSGIFRCPDAGAFSATFLNFSVADGTPGVSNGPLCGGDSAPTVTSTTPADNATGVAANTNITITFSEAVNVSGTISVVGGSSGVQNLTPTTGDNLTFTLDPTDFTAGEIVTITIDNTQVTDQDSDDPPDDMAADYVFDFTIFAPACGSGTITPIHDIQGNGATSPIDGTSGVTMEAIVVGDFQDYTADPPNELSGFFLQEEDADVDADPDTSEGIFVFDSQNPSVNVAVGDKVRVTGTVDEFGDAPDTITELIGPLTVEVCSTGNALPTAASINLPVSTLSDYEKYESMLVTFPQELTVTEVFTLGRFGEVLLSADGRLPNPTHIAEPGAPAQAVRDANILRSIILDDGLTNQNPDPLRHPEPGGLSATNTLRGGDTTTGLTGVLHYFDTTEDFRVQPTGAITWDHDNPRPATPPVVGGTLTVVGMNTLNFFTTLDDGVNDICGPLNNQECRGADSATEFTRQRDKLINALIALDADIVGLNELENNSSADPANNGDDVVLESIVDGLNAHFGTGTYAFIDTGVLGGDAIKVALIYKTTTVTPVGSFAVLDSSVDPNFDTSRNRPALAQTFEEIATGESLTVVVNHLKSKGSACGGAPDDQPDTSGGNCNGTRTLAAQALVDWLATDPTGSGDPDVLIIGDLNSYAKEDPIDVLLAAGYTDLAAAFHGADAYSYVFDGEWGYLDYGLSNSTLTPQVTGASEWHINADEPIVLDYNTEFKSAGQIASFYDDGAFRTSDHDPMVVGLSLSSGSEAQVYLTTEAPGTVDGVGFGKDDILLYSGSGDWSLFFDGATAGLPGKADITAIHVNGPTDIYLSFTQTNLQIPGFGKVNGSDIVHYNGSLAWFFDGSDVELTTGNEKIDSLHILPGSAAPTPGCSQYLLISTRGKGRVSTPSGALLFSGEDVLGFCATSLGETTTGSWSLVLDGSAEGMPNNSTVSLSANSDGSVLYLTTRAAFAVDGAVGGHSMVYRYDFGTGEFSGPFFSAPAAGLNKKVDGLHMAGDLP